MSKHTPGPWYIENVFDGGHWHTEIHGNKTGISAERIAVMPIPFKELPEGQHATYDHQVTNARLIAAAPELLHACKELHGDIHADCVTEEGCSDLCRVLEAAIAKATE